jgi:hypothetical protein
VKTKNSYHLPSVRLIDSEVLESLYRRDSTESIMAAFQLPRKRKGTCNPSTYPSKKIKTTKSIEDLYDDTQRKDELDQEVTTGSETDMGSGNKDIDDDKSEEDYEVGDQESEDSSRQPGEDLVPSHLCGYMNT